MLIKGLYEKAAIRFISMLAQEHAHSESIARDFSFEFKIHSIPITSDVFEGVSLLSSLEDENFYHHASLNIYSYLNF